MKKQKVLVLVNEYASDSQKQIDNILNEGWFIVSVTAQHVSNGSSQTKGGYLIVFEKQE
jgi:hypothetical protein